MICPVRLARDMSALQAVKVRDHAHHDLLHEGRDGAGDESTRSDFASYSQEDHVVAGGGNYRHQRPAYFEKKIGEGKHYFSAMCAVERKLVHVIYAVWKRGTPFEAKTRMQETATRTAPVGSKSIHVENFAANFLQFYS
jgi:hypothetical protein